MAEVIICSSAREGASIGADAITRLILQNPAAVLGLATGSTPTPMYRELVGRLRGVDVSRVSAFALDEYVGLSPEHPQSYRAVIDREVTRPLGLTPGRIHTPSGDLATIRESGENYEAAIRAAGGIDLQILGLGSDGHIGFNEPGSSLASVTRVKTLTQSTRDDNRRFFDALEPVPIHCVTQGIGTILRARHLMLLAFGEAKAEAVASAVEGPLSASVPGSAIQLHPRATVLLDTAAASLLGRRGYYEHAYAHKPSWQST